MNYKIKIKIILALLLISSATYAQNTLSSQTNSLRQDSVGREVINFFESGCSGENILWDFSDIEPQNAKNCSMQLYALSDRLLWDESGSLMTYLPSADSLLISRIETPLYQMDYAEPIVTMTFPFCYGSSLSTPSSGAGDYEGKLALAEEGINNVTADGYGSLILSEGDTLRNVLRVSAQRNANVSITGIVTGERTFSTKIFKEAPSYDDIIKFIEKKGEDKSYTNLVHRFKNADFHEECLLYSLIAAGKFHILSANYDIAAFLSDYFNITDLGKHSKDMAIHYFAKAEKDEFLQWQFKDFQAKRAEEKELKELQHNRKPSHIRDIKVEALKGSVEHYKKLKQELHDRNEEELLLFYSYVMADRFNYAPARKDIKDIIIQAFHKYNLGEIDKDTQYFIGIGEQFIP